MSNELAIVSLAADEFLSGDSSSKASSRYSDMSLDANHSLILIGGHEEVLRGPFEDSLGHSRTYLLGPTL